MTIKIGLIKLVSFETIVCVLCICFISLSCSKKNEEPVELLNGYKYVKTNNYNAWIIKGIGEVVDSNVIAYQIEGASIWGERSRPDLKYAPRGSMSDKYGFFILDTKSGELIEGLTKAEVNELIEIGLE